LRSMGSLMCAAALLLAGSGAIAIAQKFTTPEDLDKVMKKAGPALEASGKAIGGSAYADAKPQLAALKQAIDDSREFWVEHKRDDAIKFNKDTIAKIEQVEKLVSAEPVDAAAAAAAMKEVGGACRSCHGVYRTKDADDNYVLKPGSIDK
jgi:cytochrome c556